MKTELVDQGDEIELRMVFANAKDALAIDDNLIRSLQMTELRQEYRDNEVILKIDPNFLLP